MKHKVTCMDCGKIERIEVEHDKKIECGWFYYGKLNVNCCETDKFFWTAKDQSKPLENMVKVPNSCFDPIVKPKFAELWICPSCAVEAEKQK